ncbi:MAG: hypothetical protein EOO03_01560 [Chitinophagaceae bacterium]|nr:MAG: hypothetical protein EOO03_01560 [Chitinophagaceae bacterium]
MTSILKNVTRTLLLVTAAITIFSCSSSRRTLAIEEGWELLGESKANFVRDRDQVNVLSGERFTAIRFKVEDKDIHLSNLNIVYQSGDKLSPVMDDDITNGQLSRVIELGPEGKSIRSVDFSYRSKGNILKGRAKILVFGRRYVAPVYYQGPTSN